MKCVVRSSFLAVMAFCVSSTDLQAQAASAKGPARLGVIGGLNIAKIGGDSDFDDADNRIGLLLGASFVKPFSRNFSLEVEGLYSMKGFTISDLGDDVTFKLNYLEFPVLARFEMANSSAVTPHLYAGPSLGIRIGCGAESSGVSIDCEELEDGFDVKIKSLDLGLMLGAGVDVPLGRNTFTVGLRYTLGMTSLLSDDDSKNRAIGLYGGFSIPLKK